MSRFGQFWWDSHARVTATQAAKPLPRGKGLGGCSAINVQVAARGVPADYDGWEAAGCEGWSYQDVLRSFVGLEADLDYPTSTYHGAEGPLPIQRPRHDEMGSVDTALAEGAVALGYGWSDDHNAPASTGASPAAHNVRNGRRVSTNDAYLEPARANSNLTIRGHVHVDRVLFDQQGRAIAVATLTPQGAITYEGDEVILCAGAIYSPAILMRSGIGPGDHLRDLGLPIVADLPVGRRLNDHPSLELELVLKDKDRSISDRFGLSCLVRYSSGIQGMPANDMGFGSFNLATEASDYASGAFFVTLFRSHSYGTICLASADPLAEPIVDLNLLSDENDLARMRLGVGRLFELARHPVVASRLREVGIGRVRSQQDLPDNLDRWLLDSCETIGHPCGTAPMGSPNDRSTVVDPDCRVVGVEGLRVADASVMPTAPSAPNHLSCVMVGEHIANKILAGLRE
jgi:choline dehydrogenase